MGRIIEFTKVVFLTMLCATSFQGCAQTKTFARNNDCRSCHVTNLVSGAKDFSSIYADPASHHPAGINYPVSAGSLPDFKQPGGQLGDILFFDRNGNGLPDSDEVQLFGKSGIVRVECASCHREHGNGSAPVTTSANSYLRVDSISSALCLNCHNK